MKKLKKKLKNLTSWKNKVEIWQIEKLQTIVKTKKKLKEKNSFKKKKSRMSDKPTQQTQLFSLL